VIAFCFGLAGGIVGRIKGSSFLLWFLISAAVPFFGLFAAIAALIGKAATAQIDPLLAAIVFVSALVASPIGAAVSVRTQPRALLVILAVIVMLAAIRIALTAVTGT
jgi:uncharacterized membrane protein YfcA